ncbi:MAG: hypothetical protein SFU86_24800 [Pirellulaceae bacterium]|nr:hypothetical protein [Pirellulaceae bacterium]
MFRRIGFFMRSTQMNAPESSIPEQLARLASRFPEQRTGHAPTAVTVGHGALIAADVQHPDVVLHLLDCPPWTDTAPQDNCGATQRRAIPALGRLPTGPTANAAGSAARRASFF